MRHAATPDRGAASVTCRQLRRCCTLKNQCVAAYRHLQSRFSGAAGARRGEVPHAPHRRERKRRGRRPAHTPLRVSSCQSTRYGRHAHGAPTTQHHYASRDSPPRGWRAALHTSDHNGCTGGGVRAAAARCTCHGGTCVWVHRERRDAYPGVVPSFHCDCHSAPPQHPRHRRGRVSTGIAAGAPVRVSLVFVSPRPAQGRRSTHMHIPVARCDGGVTQVVTWEPHPDAA